MAATVPDCRKAENVVRTMLRRIQTQLGTSFEDFDLADDSIGTGSASSSGTQTSSMVDTNNSSPPDEYMDPSTSSLANFGMVQPSIVPTEDCNVTNLQQHANMADPWGVSQTQEGYDWVSHHLSVFLLFQGCCESREYLVDLFRYRTFGPF